MSRNFLSRLTKKPQDFKWWMAIALPLWVGASFVLAQVLVGGVLTLLHAMGVSFSNFDETTFQTVISAIIYLLSIAIVIGLPWIVKRYKTTANEIGLNKWPVWLDLVLAPGGFIMYAILSAILTTIATLFPFFDAAQPQDVGFTQLGTGAEYFLAFLTLVVIAPIAEEILFRGYLLGKLRKHVPLWAAILVTSLLFGAIHLSWNVGVDVFALSIVLCILRVTTGRLAPSILLHMLKNSIAFYFLFINPMF